MAIMAKMYKKYVKIKGMAMQGLTSLPLCVQSRWYVVYASLFQLKITFHNLSHTERDKCGNCFINFRHLALDKLVIHYIEDPHANK